MLKKILWFSNCEPKTKLRKIREINSTKSKIKRKFTEKVIKSTLHQTIISRKKLIVEHRNLEARCSEF